MRDDFSQPQKQSLIGVVVMFADTLQKSLRALWPLLLVFFLRSEQFSRLYIGLGVAAVVLVIGIVAYLKYINFTFHLDADNDEFVIKDGIFNKSRLAIPLDKIQQVNINQSLLQKIIGVHALEVDTAGSAKKEVSIKAVSHQTALNLKSQLLEGKARAGEHSDTEAQSAVAGENARPLISISLSSLFKTGITSNYIRSFGILLAFTITLYQYIEDFITYSDIEDDPLDNYLNAEVLLNFITFIIVGVLVLTLLINLSRTVIRYFNFRVIRQQNSLLLTYGLLNTKNTIIRPQKVQYITVGRNYFQKKLNIHDVKIRQTTNLEADPENVKTAIEIPGCNKAEKEILLEFLLEKQPEYGKMLKPNYRKLIVGLVIFILIPAVLYFTPALTFAPGLLEFLPVLPVYVVVVGTLVYFAYRNSRFFVNSEFIIRKSGAWDIDTDYLYPHKIQAIKLRQFFWQKKPDIGTIKLYTAGGDLTFGPASFKELKRLANVWLYQIETSTKHWM